MPKNIVKYLRRSPEFDLSQEELAKELGVSRGTIAHIERGGEIKLSLGLKIAKYFGKDPREIFFLDDVV